MSIDMKKFVVAKSDQLNAVDLIGGPQTFTITDVREADSGDQPVFIYLNGDGKRPYKPCKSMCRVLLYFWGDEGRDYVGRSFTLYNDPKVTWGGEEVGGIRISHMSDIREAEEIPLTGGGRKKVRHRVEPLAAKAPAKSMSERVDDYVAAIGKAVDLEALTKLTGGEYIGKLKARLEERGELELLNNVRNAESKREVELTPREEAGEVSQNGTDDDDLDDGDGFPVSEEDDDA